MLGERVERLKHLKNRKVHTYICRDHIQYRVNIGLNECHVISHEKRPELLTEAVGMMTGTFSTAGGGGGGAPSVSVLELKPLLLSLEDTGTV